MAADAEGPVFAAAPPERVELPGGLALVRWEPARAAATVAAVNESLDHLSPWMAWAAEPATEARLAQTLRDGARGWDERRDFPYTILDEATGHVVGGCGLHGRIGPHGLEIGYWVHAARLGQGIATAAARALTEAAFAIAGIERVRICLEDGNVRSARVPAKLGFSLIEVTVPDAGPCAGRPTQIWEVERADWS